MYDTYRLISCLFFKTIFVFTSTLFELGYLIQTIFTEFTTTQNNFCILLQIVTFVIFAFWGKFSPLIFISIKKIFSGGCGLSMVDGCLHCFVELHTFRYERCSNGSLYFLSRYERCSNQVVEIFMILEISALVGIQPAATELA